MKVTTINGETLRKEFTALEAAAIKHAAENCVAGDTFVGVPTSNEERYRNNDETFRVVEYSGQNLVVVRHKTGNEMRAKNRDFLAYRRSEIWGCNRIDRWAQLTKKTYRL